MTTALALGLSLLASPQTAPATATITLANGNFQVVAGEARATVPVATPIPAWPKPTNAREWAFTATRVRFDTKGLTISRNNQPSTSRLASVATSKMLFSPDEIDRIKRLVRQGERKLEVSGLSGAVLDGTTLYLLLRWDERDGNPWLEGIFKLEVADRVPEVRFVGKLPGYSFANGTVENRLIRQGDKLVAPVRAQDGWGIGSWDIKSGETNFTRLGNIADDVLIESRTGMVTSFRRTNYESVIVSVAPPSATRARDIVEMRGSLLGSQIPALLAFTQGRTIVLFNANTGAKLAAPPDPGFLMTDAGLLVWAPRRNPSAATLYDGNMTVRARWNR